MNSKQRHYLRGEAHHLKPVINIGKLGVTAGALHCINDALKSHELIKIKFTDHKNKHKILYDEISQKLNCSIAGIIGNTVILYKQQTNPEKQKIQLP